MASPAEAVPLLVTRPAREMQAHGGAYTAGFSNVDLYLATRHYFGWYAMNVLELPCT